MTVPFAFDNKGFNEDDDSYTFEGYASTFGNVDLGNDRVLHGAFKRCLNDMSSSGKTIPVLWQHDMTMPLGTYTEMREDGRGLFVKGCMPKDDTFVSGRVVPQMKAGSISSMSIGYIADQWEMNGDVRDLKELTLWEVSLVTQPMNEEARVTDMKSAVPYQDLPLADESRPWDSSAAKKRVRSFTESGDEPSKSYKKAFLWYDSENDEDFGGYKLPIADVIDGKLVAVPRGIFAAAAAVQGARGGVRIPDSDVGTVKSSINKYYKKMDRESPFDGKSLVIHKEMLEELDVRSLDNVLRSNIKMTRSAVKKFISCLNVETLRDAGEKVAHDAKKDTFESFEDMLENIKQI
ncbi:MAG: HK97 family phage prohead protease [Gammaproteobacteria bacterium]|nr:HK97 family phage prohead protease [Gammaproteobacteria bacterium]